MTAREYLGQAYRIEQRINSKVEQVASLRELSLKVTTTLSDAPKGSRNVHSKEKIVTKMIDLENEINADIDALVDLKKEILSVIKAVERVEYRTLLEMRYLCYNSWEQIAIGMGYSLQHVFRLHSKALKEIKIKDESKCD